MALKFRTSEELRNNYDHNEIFTLHEKKTLFRGTQIPGADAKCTLRMGSSTKTTLDTATTTEKSTVGQFFTLLGRDIFSTSAAISQR